MKNQREHRPDFQHTGRRHHYIAKTAQELNSENGKNIYKFPIHHHEREELRLPFSTLIKDNFVFRDLYTIDKGDGFVRNFEEHFQEYEGQYQRLHDEILHIARTTPQVDLMSGPPALVEKLRKMLTIKMLDFFRNPFCIEMSLDSFPKEFDPDVIHPVDPYYLEHYQLIEKLRDNAIHERYVSLGVDRATYIKWLKMQVLLMLNPKHLSIVENADVFEDKSLLEQSVDGMLEPDGETGILIQCHLLSKNLEHRFVVSDRSFLYYYEGKKQVNLSFHFNISSTLAISYYFRKREQMIDAAKEVLPPDKVKNRRFLEFFVNEMLANPNVAVLEDNLKELLWFNRSTISQAYEHVCCEKQTVFGAKDLTLNRSQ